MRVSFLDKVEQKLYVDYVLSIHQMYNEYYIFLNVVLVRPLTVEIRRPMELSEGGSLTAERRYEVSCESAGSRPPALISWYKGKRQLKRITVSNLIIIISTLTYTSTIFKIAY